MKISEKKEKMKKIVRRLERKLDSIEDPKEKELLEEEISQYRKKINDIVDEQRNYSGLSSGEKINQYPYF